jgi:hypothetical protein
VLIFEDEHPDCYHYADITAIRNALFSPERRLLVTLFRRPNTAVAASLPFAYDKMQRSPAHGHLQEAKNSRRCLSTICER